MFNPNDPRYSRLDAVSQRLESANEIAQISIFSCFENYLKPCYASVGECVGQTTETCLPNTRRDDRRRRTHRPPRGRLERSFDFYDDWEEDENDALIAWENEEHDRLLGDDAGAGPATHQPPRRGIMNYGTSTSGAVIRAIGGTGAAGARRPARRVPPENDPTVIPNQSYFGFLDRLPFKIGPRGLRYKPSSAGLQERPRDTKGPSEAGGARPHRTRSGTVTSEQTEDSMSSRGDIFPSDDELEDAVALDDEFAARLMPDDNSSGKTRKERRHVKRAASSGSPAHTSAATSRRDSASDEGATSTLAELKKEEQRVKMDEEREVQSKREAAARLARERGLEGELGVADAESAHPDPSLDSGNKATAESQDNTASTER